MRFHNFSVFCCSIHRNELIARTGQQFQVCVCVSVSVSVSVSVYFNFEISVSNVLCVLGKAVQCTLKYV